MINFVSSQPVQWPTTSAPAASQVSAVSAVARTQRTSGEGQSGLGSERDPRFSAAPKSGSLPDTANATPQAAPLLPRAPSANGERSDASASDKELNQEPFRQDQQADEAASAKALSLLEVLSTVWKASAAVVEEALGIGDASKGALEGKEATPLNRLSPASAQADLAKDATLSATDPLLGRAAGDPVAYTEQGASEWMAIETGQLLRKLA